MGLGSTLIGGIVGAAVGVAIHVALATGMFGEPIEASWFAIVTGLLTGLGVRQATKPRVVATTSVGVDGAGNEVGVARVAPVSYARGALSALIALAAIVLTFPAIQKAMTMNVKAAEPRAEKELAKTDETEDEGDAADAADEPAEDPAPKAAPVAAARVDNKLPAMPNDFSEWQFAYMAIGALLAYQFGRGSDAPAYRRPVAEAPVAMDPSN